MFIIIYQKFSFSLNVKNSHTFQSQVTFSIVRLVFGGSAETLFQFLTAQLRPPVPNGLGDAIEQGRQDWNFITTTTRNCSHIFYYFLRPDPKVYSNTQSKQYVKRHQVKCREINSASSRQPRPEEELSRLGYLFFNHHLSLPWWAKRSRATVQTPFQL